MLPRIADRDLREQAAFRDELPRGVRLPRLRRIGNRFSLGFGSGNIFSTSLFCWSNDSVIFRCCSRDLSSISPGSRMMCGVSMISRFVFLRDTDLNRNRFPSSGMSPRRGIWLTEFVKVSCIIPPSTTVFPFFTSTLVFADRFVVVGPTAFTFSRESPFTADDSWKISRFTKSLSWMWGVRRSVIPTSLRSTVLMTLARFVESRDWLVMKGTFSPTTISASLLSRVSR